MKTKQYKTLFLDQGEVLGGAERYLIDFLKNLAPTEKNLLKPLLFGGHSKDYQNKLPQDFPRQDFLFPSLKGGIIKKLLGGIKIIFAGKKLTKEIKKHAIQTVVTNSPRAHFIMFMNKALFRESKTRWIILFHDLTTQKKFWKPLHIWLRRNMLTYADNIVAVSLVTRSTIKEIVHKKHHRKISIIENGIQTDQIPKQNSPKEIRNILHIGRISPEKGQFHTLEAAHILSKAHPQLEFRIVGPVFTEDNLAKEYYDKCKQFVEQKNLKNITFVGETDEPWTEVQNCDLMVIPATRPETFGRTVIEGLITSKITIASNMTGPGNIMKEYLSFLKEPLANNKLIIPPHNSLALAKSIEHFVQNPQDIPICTQKGRAFVEKNYDFTETKKRLLQLIRNK